MLADVDGIPMAWSAPHPFHVAANQAAEALKAAEAVHAAATIAKNADPDNDVASAQLLGAQTALDTASQAMHQAAEAASGVLPVVLEHWFPVLMALHGDTPFAAKLRHSVGIAAPAACPRCMLLASKRKPTEDGSPGDTVLNATSYGGCACKAERNAPIVPEAGPCSMSTHAGFEYSAEDGSFDKEAAKLLLIDDDRDELIAEAALVATEKEREIYVTELNNKLAALGPNATVQDKAKGTFQLIHTHRYTHVQEK